MGIIQPNGFKDRHFLHSFRFTDHRLKVYLPDSSNVEDFEIYNQNRKFRFSVQSSISVPNGAVYLVGGRVLEESPHNAIFQGALSGGLPSYNSTTCPYSLITTSQVWKINLNKHKDNRIDISNSRHCPSLPEPRHSHVLLYCEQYIYVIGGKINDITPTRSCLRFHIKERLWTTIRDLDLAVTNLTSLSGLAIAPSKDRGASRRLYVFDTSVVPLPSIFQYNTDTNCWMQMIIEHKNKGVVIPSSINATVFQLDQEKLIIFSGTHIIEQRNQAGYSYTLDLVSEKIGEFCMEDKNLDFVLSDRQGDRNYTKNKNIYLQFGESYAYYFDKEFRHYKSIELKSAPLTTRSSSIFDIGCCSRKY